MSTELFWEAFGEWIFGAFTCKLATYIQCLLFASTAFILMSMSFDRYEAICKPMAFSRTISRSRKMIIASWILAIIVAIPQLFIFLQVNMVYKHYKKIPQISVSPTQPTNSIILYVIHYADGDTSSLLSDYTPNFSFVAILLIQ